MIKSLFFRALIKSVGRLPLRVLRHLGALIGNLLWLSRSRMWLVTLENIERCYPALDSGRQALLARESLKETGKTITETTLAWARPVDGVLPLIHGVHGESAVESALQGDSGVVFVMPHLGNWEIINHYLGRQYGLTHMYQPNRNKRITAFIQDRRGRTGTQFVPTDRSGIRAQMKILRQGGCIGVMPDQEPLIHTGRFAPFFGIDALTNELVAGFRKTGAHYFTAVCERTSDGFEIRFEAIDLPEPEQALEAINLAIENAVRKRPAQYLWSYKRFRTRPAGKLDFYQFDRHPLRTGAESVLLWCYVRLAALLPPVLTRLFSKLVAKLPFLLTKRRKISRINLQACEFDADLIGPATTALVQSALEAPRIWLESQPRFDARLESIEGSINSDKGSLVLTPPLASREALMRFLGNRFFTTEYYHPNSITALDRIIRNSRYRHGISLVEHDDEGLEILLDRLGQHQIATLCPDQQPRLRGGHFIPFFGTPALTTRVLPTLLKAARPELLLGVAWRHGSRFRVSLEPLTYDTSAADEIILHQINQQLETAIQRNPAQYRWSDKRFNIRPIGKKKLYR